MVRLSLFPLFRLFLSHKQSALRQLTADPFVCPHPFPALRTEKRKDPSLSGSLSQTVLSAEVSETEAQAEEDAEGTGAKENGAEEMTEESEEKEEEENKEEGENGRHD